MNYQDEATPILDVAAVKQAVKDGALIQYTYFANDSYDCPRDEPYNEGWVDVIRPHTFTDADWRALWPPGRVRAFYPIHNHDAYMAAARTLRDEE